MARDCAKVRGMMRVTINKKTGELVGDSGWMENKMTNEGIEKFILYTMGNSSGSSQASAIALGTGTSPASNATTLPGEISLTGDRPVVSSRAYSSRAASSDASTLYFYASCSGSKLSASASLQNVGVFATIAGGTLFAGQSFTSSAWATNQNVNITYGISISNNQAN